MSLATTLTALQNARGGLVDAIGSKGVALASSATLLECASAVLTISQGSGGTDVSSTTAEAADVLSGKVFYNSGGTLTSGAIATVSASIESDSVIVPVGYIAVSQTFPISSGSGGVDVSDTTAEAANVQSGYYFYTSAGVKTEGTLTVSGGIDVSDTTAAAGMVLSGYIFHDSTGAVTTGTIPTVSASLVSGSVVVPSGYVASSQTFPVSSGADAVLLGYVDSNGYFQPLTFSGTTAYDSGIPELVSSYYTWNTPVSSGSSGPETGSAVRYYSGGSLISSAQTMTSQTFAGGSLVIDSGGTAYKTYMNDGEIVVNSGGTASGIYINGTSGDAVATVYPGARANGVTLGVQNNQYSIWFGVASSGYASSVTLSGGVMRMRGGYAQYVVISSGGTVTFSGGPEWNEFQSGGGAVISATIHSGGTMDLASTGLADWVIVSSGGKLIDSFGNAGNVTSKAGAIIISN